MSKNIKYKTKQSFSKKRPFQNLISGRMLGIFNSILIVSLLLCDVFVFKVVKLCHFTIALSGCLFPITFLMLICINETYGHKQTAASIINLVVAQFLFLLGLMFLIKAPSPQYNLHIADTYTYLFKGEYRVLISSVIGISISLYFASIINSKLKLLFWGKFLVARILVNAIITKAIMVAIIYPINFIGIYSLSIIIGICVDTYVFKIIMAVIVVYLSYPIVYICKKLDKRDVYDVNVKYGINHIFDEKNSGINLYEKTH